MTKYIALCGLAASLALTSCGSKAGENAENQDSTATTASVTGPYEATSRSYSQDVEVGSHHYRVAIACQADKGAVVRDQLDTEFYDNLISVTISEAGSELASHTFRKSDFQGSYDAAHSILQGMAYSDYRDGQFIFGCQVGEPGNDEGGANFRVTMTSSGSVSITPDYTQDTSANESYD